MTFLQLLPLLFILAGLILYTVLAGAQVGPGEHGVEDEAGEDEQQGQQLQEGHVVPTSSGTSDGRSGNGLPASRRRIHQTAVAQPA